MGRSCILLESGGTRIMVDAGIKLGKSISFPQVKKEELKYIDAVLISHAHLDHCGYLPHLYSEGYTGKVYATKPTLELINVLIADYMSISEPRDVTKEGLARLAKSYEIVDYKKEIRIKNMRIKFIPAGHILGSALISVSDGIHTILYTGDMYLHPTRLLDGADTKNLNADILITESTNGADTDVFNPKEVTKKLLASIRETLLAGGKVIIPSFAVGRAEEMLLLLGDYLKSGVIPKVPIYVDGMINKAMRIHRHNVIFCRKELQSSILMSDFDPFKNENFTPIESMTERKKVVAAQEASIIVTTSGMLTGGPVLFYLPRLASNPINRLLFIGYQAQGTLGREIQDGAREVQINRRPVKIQMTIESYRLSGHADRAQLEALPSKINGLKKIFVVHGESTKEQEFGKKLAEKYETLLPKIGEEYNI